MTWLVVVAPVAISVLFVAVVLAVDARCERRSRRAQHIPGWVNAPDAAHLTVVPDEPRSADVISFPGTHHSGAGARR